MKRFSRIHLTGIGENVMGDLAVSLKALGHQVSGSYDVMLDSARTKLEKSGILPTTSGWSAENITPDVTTLIISPEIGADNPELQRAQKLNLQVYSYPDFIYHFSKNKQRLVVAGSYGKTTITLLIMHVLNFHSRKFDFVVVKEVKGLENQVRLSDAPLIIIEGQDLMASKIDVTPSFLKYQHHVGIISGIEWEESPAYPTMEAYSKQFSLFEEATPKGGILVYFELGPVKAALSKTDRTDVLYIPYKAHAGTTDGGQEYLVTSAKEMIPLKLTGKHNLQNISAAKETLKKIGITSEMFYQAIPSFAGNRQ